MNTSDSFSPDSFRTADLCDAHEGPDDPAQLRVLPARFLEYGARHAFSGPVATVRVMEDNVLVREMLTSPGRDRVLVVDGGASLRCALVGDMLALLAVDNGWAGVVVYGAIRDSRETGTMPLGLRALGTNPRRSLKSGQGEREIPISIGDVTVAPGEWLYADEDGIVISAIPLTGNGTSQA